MKAVTIKDPFTNGADRQLTVKEALHLSATYLAQARYIYANMPDPTLLADMASPHALKGQLAAQIGHGYAVLADTLGQDY